MKMMNRLASGVALTVLVCAMSTAVYAQETTGSLRGQVTDETGAAIGGATVTVTHAPTGSASTSMTGPDGYFSARGLRVGGPYRVTATAPAFDRGQVTVQSVGVGDPANVEVLLYRPGSAEVAELVVTGAAAAVSQGGPSSNYTATVIEELPSISRDLKDVARLDPFATIDASNQDALSFAGTNTRFNQLTVNGVRQNDDFGLNNNGYPTQRSPIPLDAVGAVNVSIAPYSPINNGFTGGQINAVIKSGGNEFSGSIFAEKTGRDFQGDTIRGAPAGTAFEEKNWGVTLGGPIIKDTLFFFLAYEKFEGELGFDEGPTGSGASVIIPRISTQAVDLFQTDTKRVYNYDPGNYLSGAFPVEDEKKLVKFDWNITDKHRAEFVYQNTLGNSLNGSTSSTFAQGNSVTQPRVGLETNDYNKIEELTVYTVQVNSQWTENFSTEFRYSSKETDTQQNPLGGLGVGEVNVTVNDLPGVAAGAGNAQIRFGADINRHDNYLNVKVETLEAIARYNWGAHDFMVGLRTEQDDVLNVFVGNSLGSYTFSSYANYLSRVASGFTLAGGVNPTGGTVPATLGTARAGAATFGYRLTSLYAEDRLQVLPNLDILAGVRFDTYSMDDLPTFNAAFQSRNGFSNQQNLDGKHVVLPRVSFNWEPMERLRVSGGVGRFSSTGLNVWVSNAFSNNGVNQTNAICTGTFTNVDLTKAPAGCTFTPGNGNTNIVSPGFQIPTVWKANISVGYEFDLGRFGDGWLVQADYIRSTNQNALYWYDLRARQIGVAPDGRAVYGRNNVGTTTGNDFDFMLGNIDKGGSESYALTIAKSWNEGFLEGLGGRFVYTHTESEDANPMTSSIAFSSYTRFATVDAQRPSSERSDYEIRDRFAVDVSYARKFFGDNKTSLRLFAQQRTGLPFSYTFANSRSGNFDNDFGQAVSSYSGRQASSNALLYVPQAAGGSVTATSDPRVTYGPGFNVAAFNTFLQQSGLIGYAGSIVPRNAFDNPDVTTVDLRLSQELPAFFPNGAKLLVYMDVENLGNLLNDEWGVTEQYDFYRGVPVVNVQCGAGGAPACAAPGAVYTYSGTGVGGAFQNPVKPFLRSENSLWQVKVGVKYKF
ncbi:TonB-dependent receptor [Phenylobacterium sp.]|uniref:TonB-dependent receptor n=1 Tax=Phenylobacterium sp. TaxID=1871053 RepID=UPI0027327978|nr:TonB-dependent receptor [Phenylobacterium sp.]MDP3855014.1 TonB-dependent receptor [Phenylobacterium sp.]